MTRQVGTARGDMTRGGRRAPAPTRHRPATGAEAPGGSLTSAPLDQGGLLATQRLLGNRAALWQLQQAPNTSEPMSRQPVPLVPWTGDPVSMANALRNLLLSRELDRIADSLAMLWVRGMVDTLRMLKLDAGAYATIVGSARFKGNTRLMAAHDVVEGRPPTTAGLFTDQAIELRAMHDVPNWPTIIGPHVKNSLQLPNPDQVSDPSIDPVLTSPAYRAALFDAIRRNRTMTGQYLLNTVKARPADNVPGGYKYVGPSHKGDSPSELNVPDPKREEVNKALWKELGVGEGTQASINTWDTAKFSFGPGFAAVGLLGQVMDNLAKAGSEVLVPLRNAGLIFEKGTWYVVDTEAQAVRSGKPALELLSKDVGLIQTFLDTAGDAKMRRQWMDAEWKAMQGAGGAAAVPPEVVENWPVELIVFVAHCVHWGGPTWKEWKSATPPSLFHVVRTQAKHVDRRADDPRILTHLSAGTFLGFSNRLLERTLRTKSKRMGIEANLPDDWKTGFAGAVALPTKTSTPVFHVIEADE
ncbi:hypothetical protein F4553_001303 [Allocatelliglobosispora scoriae]|uniref:Uncharacterized protein n=1 Tax=Allocatelliglobosispora scoriae TaxID=643052 RepID=A0A841BI19_9ACTN|nr:hypothetical protein [Allocatelliglobosispora scoriae]MBB5867924.1 hypothetical protein [Allocatelliglobosispora scoriae]